MPDPKDDAPKKDEPQTPAKPPPVERRSVTKHAVEIAGETVEYTATAGTLFLRDEEDEPRASVFYVAYTREGVDPATRPITFAFNGGPGSSAVWLQLGALGPRRADVPDAAPSPPPPHRLVDNAESILDLSDLVFVDPVGTGYSRPLGKAKAEEFHGVKGDVESVGEFVRRYLSRHARWNSPRFLAGESYGATRAAALSAHLSSQGLMVNGVLLLSPALMFQTLAFETGNDLPNILYLPGYALTAAYHGTLPNPPPDLDGFRDEVERYALEEYAPALLAGASLPEDRRQQVAARLANYTGLSAELWLRYDLRIDLSRFCRELRRDDDRIVGRLDSRFSGILAHANDDPGEHDPSLHYPFGPYAALINDYLRRELEYEEERKYEVISFDVNERWRWRTDEAGAEPFGYLNVATDLRRAMVQNPHLSVFFANGYYDLATPYFASMHTARHLGREPEIRAQVHEAFYEAGHMMYLHEPSRKKLREDLVRFYAEAAPGC
jgi:carboxypeptidase C (cathepsin A)